MIVWVGLDSVSRLDDSMGGALSNVIQQYIAMIDKQYTCGIFKMDNACTMQRPLGSAAVP